MALGEHYQSLMGRLISSLRKHDDPVDVVSWSNTLPPGAPGGDMPWAAYCAKPFALKAAADQGYDIVLWLDTAYFAVKHSGPIFDHIEGHEYYVQQNGNMVGNWCTDAALETLEISREEAMQIPEIASGAIGLDVRKLNPHTFMNEWCRLASDGVTFIGAHANEALGREEIVRRRLPDRTVGFVSHDKRVFGHRHDQTAASVIAHKLGWVGVLRPDYTDYWSPDQHEKVLFANRGGLF